MFVLAFFDSTFVHIRGYQIVLVRDYLKLSLFFEKSISKIDTNGCKNLASNFNVGFILPLVVYI